MMRLPVVLTHGPAEFGTSLLDIEPMLEDARANDRHIVVSVKHPTTGKTETFYLWVAEVSEVEET